MEEIESRVEALVQKIKHLLIVQTGHTLDEAPLQEFYQAFCLALREELMMNWTATNQNLQKYRPRTLYFLSMEYLPGRFLTNNIYSLGAQELIERVLQKTQRNLSDLMTLENDPGLGNGGLGRLSSCFLDSLATLHYPAKAYGLRYQYGIFEQQLWNGRQMEKPDCWLLNSYPWEFRKDVDSVTVCFRGEPIPGKNKHGDDVYSLQNYEEARALAFVIPIIGYCEKKQYSVVSLCLWSTKESPRNFELQRYNAGFLDQASENTSLTDVLYPNDNTEMGKRVRLKQEFLLASASLQDILHTHLQLYGDLNNFADKARIQINDTHPALTIVELVRTLTKNYDFSWGDAWEVCKSCCSYTNHTILSEALEQWNEERFQELIPRQFHILQRLNFEFCEKIRSRFPNDESKVQRMSILHNGQAQMAHLAILGSHTVNGVAKLHTEILKQEIFKDFYDLFPEKFVCVTNGVTQRRWLCYANPLLSEFITQRIGRDWIFHFSEIEKLAPFASDPSSQQEFLRIKKENKKKLLYFFSQQVVLRDEHGVAVGHPPSICLEALFDVQIKRVHEYKRQLLSVLYLLVSYLDLCQSPERPFLPRYVIFSGKAAPGYEKAKQIVELIGGVSRKISSDPICKDKLCVTFVENYGVSIAEQIIPAADLSEQISAAGWEASGTGNMKLALNGALTIGTEDGANVEMREAIGDAWWPFQFGSSAEENRAPYNPTEIYEKDELVRKAVDSLKDPRIQESIPGNGIFSELHSYLCERDPFRILKDFRSYYETQKKVETLYQQPEKWAEMALHNIAAMGRFSADSTIREYAEKVWKLTPCPPDPEVFDKVREEYTQHDRCKIEPPDS